MFLLEQPHTSALAEGHVLELAQSRYDACHPGDSFSDLVRRSRFSKEDRMLLQEWLEAARHGFGG